MITLLKGPAYLLYRRRIANMTDDELEIELGERLQRTHSWPDDDDQWKRDCIWEEFRRRQGSGECLS